MLYTFKLWFAFSSPFTVITFVQTSGFTGLLSGLLSWAFPTSDHHSYWTHNSDSVATTSSELLQENRAFRKILCIIFLNSYYFGAVLETKNRLLNFFLALWFYNKVWFLTFGILSCWILRRLALVLISSEVDKPLGCGHLWGGPLFAGRSNFSKRQESEKHNIVVYSF